MFLRSLTMRGFKSFADKTILEFAPGVSVIVGPNGSGKSNIADAISWVLGEQGVRSLRGAQMADVIFAGSPTRPPLGMAQVTLVIDNSAGLISVPASEIEISRSIFRSGDSEYRLGGRPCRLLDIQEMLSDAGLGRALHAVVGQSQLDEVLQARPEERRQVIEEAAGIAKHRRRRERAERKLAGLDADLARLQDVVGELRRQLRPLEKQAELAAKHEQLSTEATTLARRIAAARLRELHRQREARRPSWERAEAIETEGRERLDELDRAIAREEQERAEAEADEVLADEAHSAAMVERSSSESALRDALRREADTRDRLATATEGAGRLFTLQEELEWTERALEEASSAFEAKEVDLARAEDEFRARDRARSELEEQHRRASSETAARLAQAETLRGSLVHQEAEQDRLVRMLGELKEKQDLAAGREEELGAEVERLDALSTPLTKELAALDAERAELGRELAGLEASERGFAAQSDALDRRLDELSESPGTAFAKRRGDRPIGVLAELIEIPRSLEPAVRGALGPFADAVVYAKADEVLSEASAADGGVGVLLAVADGSAPRFSIPGERSLLDLVRVDARVRGLAGSILADCYLVTNLAEAGTKHRMHPHAHFVTEAGVVVGPSFVRTPARVGAGADAIHREMGALERELAAVRRGLREGRRRLSDLEARAATRRAELEEIDTRITAAAEEMSRTNTEVASLNREREVVGERLRSVLGSSTATRARLAGEPEMAPGDLLELPPRPEPPITLRVEVEALRRERGRLEGGIARMRRELEALRTRDPASMRAELSLAEEERGRLEVVLREAEAAAESVLAVYRQATEAARRARDAHAETNRAWREQLGLVERLRTEHEVERRIRTELEARIADAERTLRDGHGFEPAPAIEELAEDDTVETLQRRAEVVARRLGLMGKVNLLASGELSTLRERHDFMVRELEDVKAARRDLMEVIRDVDRTMAELFVEAFRDVAERFAALFGVLFPGGDGRLTLVDPTDPLGSGVEVEARPGRKKVKRLSLLSGGERSLTALAFLIAIFQARPSPFYLLDEVEAALDDINLHRFLEVARELAARSQVLIVTHQKRTMEMADVLYGVSMGSGGTSNVLSQRLAAEGVVAVPDEDSAAGEERAGRSR